MHKLTTTKKLSVTSRGTDHNYIKVSLKKRMSTTWVFFSKQARRRHNTVNYADPQRLKHVRPLVALKSWRTFIISRFIGTKWYSLK